MARRCSFGSIYGLMVLFWYSYAKDQHISVKRSMEAEYLDDLFNLLLSVQAFEEYQLLQTKVHNTPYDISVNDFYGGMGFILQFKKVL